MNSFAYKIKFICNKIEYWLDRLYPLVERLELQVRVPVTRLYSPSSANIYICKYSIYGACKKILPFITPSQYSRIRLNIKKTKKKNRSNIYIIIINY